MTDDLMDALFDDAGLRIEMPEIPPGLSVGRRRTIRRLQLIALGIHPVTRAPLHPDAPLDASSKDRYVRPLTEPVCGNCAHRIKIKVGVYEAPKCDITTMAHSAGANTYRWFPACVSYRPIDSVSLPVIS